MNRIIGVSVGVAAVLALASGPSYAEDPAGTPPADPTATAQTTLQTKANGEAETHAGDVLAGIQARAAKTNAKAAAKVNAKLDASVKATDAAAAGNDAKIADRLATEFGMTSDALTAEKNSLNTSWGQLMIAHTLMANSSAGVTAQDIFSLRTQGMGWGEIANGMGLRLGDVVSAANAEMRVAKGLDKADGRVATVHGPGSNAGAGMAKAGTHAGTHAKGGGAATGAATTGAASSAARNDAAKMGVGAGAGRSGR